MDGLEGKFVRAWDKSFMESFHGQPCFWVHHLQQPKKDNLLKYADDLFRLDLKLRIKSIPSRIIKVDIGSTEITTKTKTSEIFQQIYLNLKELEEKAIAYSFWDFQNLAEELNFPKKIFERVGSIPGISGGIGFRINNFAGNESAYRVKVTKLLPYNRRVYTFFIEVNVAKIRRAHDFLKLTASGIKGDIQKKTPDSVFKDLFGPRGFQRKLLRKKSSTKKRKSGKGRKSYKKTKSTKERK
jgi:hypothetical protein